jgi:hypothetical protein
MKTTKQPAPVPFWLWTSPHSNTTDTRLVWAVTLHASICPVHEGPGKRNRVSTCQQQKRDPYDPVMELIVDELDHLDRVGFQVYDAHTKQNLVLHAKLLFFLSDLRGHQSFTTCSCSPAYRGCIKCWHRALGKAGRDSRGKMLYCPHFTLLPKDHPLRQPLHELHNPFGEVRLINDKNTARSGLFQRTCTDLLLTWNVFAGTEPMTRSSIGCRSLMLTG